MMAKTGAGLASGIPNGSGLLFSRLTRFGPQMDQTEAEIRSGNATNRPPVPPN